MASRNSGCAVTSRRASSMSRQRPRAPRRTPLSPMAMLPSPETRRRSTSVLGAASRKARTGIRLCPPAMTVASGSDTSRSIASRSVAGTWYSKGAGFIRSPPNARSSPMSSARALFDKAGAAPSPTSLRRYRYRPDDHGQGGNCSGMRRPSSLLHPSRATGGLRNAAEGAKRSLDHHRIEPPGDEYQTRPPNPIGPCAQMPRRMNELLYRMYRDRCCRVSDVEDALHPQQLIAMAVEQHRQADAEPRP